MRFLVAAFLVAAIGTSNPYANPQSNPQSAIRTPQSEDRLVTIDVTVTDSRGRTLTDLKPSDFDLLEGTLPLPLESVRLVRVAPAVQADALAGIQSAADERLAAGQDQARLFAIFLDEYHVSGGTETERVRDALTRFVDRDVSPRDLIVVMKPLDSLFAIRLTRDREAVRRAIESFEGRKGDYEPRNAYERDFIAGTPARIDVARAQVALSAINALAVHLGSLTDRRKTLIVASDGVGRADHRRGLENLPTLDTIIRSANRSNVSVYPFDPRDAADAAPGAELRRLADETDGGEIAADAEPGLRRLNADASAYYLLSFRTRHPDDGRFRELQATVKRPGAVVRARKGYWTASPDEAMRAALIAKANEPKVVVPPEPAPHASTLIRPWFGMARGENGKTRVTFVWEPAARVPGDRVRHTVSKLEFQARSADGTVLFKGPVAPTGPAAIDEPAATSARVVFDVPPGRLRLNMSIQDAASTVLDEDVREMSIRDLKGDVAVGTPEILRARTAREFRTIDGEAAAVPVASREFSRTERLLVRFYAYGPAGQPPVASAALLDRVGHPIRALTIAPMAAAGEYAIDLPLAGFAPGDYTIAVKAASGAREATDRTAFRVTY
jgi:VWFA-related protein